MHHYLGCMKYTFLFPMPPQRDAARNHGPESTAIRPQ